MDTLVWTSEASTQANNCIDPFLKQLTVCCYALIKVKINDYMVCGKGESGTRNTTGN